MMVSSCVSRWYQASRILYLFSSFHERFISKKNCASTKIETPVQDLVCASWPKLNTVASTKIETSVQDLVCASRPKLNTVVCESYLNASENVATNLTTLQQNYSSHSPVERYFLSYHH